MCLCKISAIASSDEFIVYPVVEYSSTIHEGIDAGVGNDIISEPRIFEYSNLDSPGADIQSSAPDSASLVYLLKECINSCLQLSSIFFRVVGDDLQVG